MIASVVLWLIVLRLGAHAGPEDLAKATLGVPHHPTAADLAVSLARGPSASRHGFRGRVAFVTGATSGVGLETAGALAEAGFHVLMGARSPQSAEHARGAVERRARRRGLGGSADLVRLDLADLASVARAVHTIDRHGALHLLVCSAGVMPSPLGGAQSITADGIELVWGVNHLGHFALAQGLHAALKRGVASGFPARLVLVSSEHGHRYFGAGGLPASLPPPAEGWDPFRAYGISKLSNILHAREAGRRWVADGISAIAAHPGIVRPLSARCAAPASFATRLHNLGVWIWWHVIAFPIAEPIEGGAASVIYAALSLSRNVPFAYVVLQLAEPALAQII